MESGPRSNVAVLILIIAAIVIAVGAFVYIQKSPIAPTEQNGEETKTPDKSTNGAAVTPRQEAVVRYTDDGFVPQTVQIELEQTVKFVNESSGNMWVATGVHPIHQLYPEFNQRIGVGKGGAFSFKFTRKGNWKYHNHLNPLKTGTVEVR